MKLFLFGDSFSPDRRYPYFLVAGILSLCSFVLLSFSANAQSITVTGKVTDEHNSPLTGVSVREKNANNGTYTQSNGTFSIQVQNGNSVLVFSYIGFNEKEISLAGQSHLHVSLTPKISELNDVVVIAYGTQKKLTLTSSQSSISSKDFSAQPVTRLDQALQGRTTGVQVTNATGAPGGDVRIRIRGANSVTGNNDPLYVVDGLVGADFSSINPDDIASIEILKDAAATAPYGSRGANGVIIVTTKKGKTGQMHLKLTARVSSSKVAKTYDKLNAADYAKTVNAYDEATGVTPYFTQDQISQFEKNGGTDWQKAIFRNAIGHQYELSMDGGSDKTTYYISGSYKNLPGIIKNSSYKFYSIRSNVNAHLLNKLSAFINFNGYVHTNVNTNLNAGTANPIVQAIAWSPTVPLYYAAGYHHLMRSDPIGSDGFNPMAEVRERIAKTNSYNADINGGFTYQIIPDLSLKIQYAVGYSTNIGHNFGDLNVSPEGGYANSNSGTSVNLQNTNTLHYTHIFNDVHHLDLTAVFEMQQGQWSGFNAGINQLIYPSFKWNNLGLGTPDQPGSSTNKSAIVSEFARAGYTYKDKYLFTGTIRRDASSVFRGKNKVGYFPSLSLGWVLSQEDFIKNLNAFDELKLRASWGLTGNQAIGPYSTYSTYKSVSATYNNSSHVPGIEIDRSGNPDLKWETTEQKDVGLNIALHSVALHASFDYFKKNTRDLLFFVGLPMYAGGGGTEKNIGEVQNNGWEIAIGGTPVQSGDFIWNTDFNYSSVKNKIIKLTGEGDLFYDPNIGWGMTSSPEFVLRTGQPMGAFWGLKYLGTWKPKEKTEAASYGAQPGDSHYADINGDHKISTDDNTIIGYGLPKFTAGWNNTFQYKGFELNVFLQGVFGFDKLNFLYGAAMGNSGDFRQAMLADIKNRYVPGVNETSDIPAFSTTNQNFIQSSRFISKGDFIRFKNISLSYTLPKSVIRNIASIKLFLSGENLFTITNYTGMDPEATNDGSGSDAGQSIDYGAYPIPKTVTAGLTLDF